MSWIEKTKSGLRYVDRIKVNGEYKKISTPIEKDTPQARRKAAETIAEKARANYTIIILQSQQKCAKCCKPAKIVEFRHISER